MEKNSSVGNDIEISKHSEEDSKIIVKKIPTDSKIFNNLVQIVKGTKLCLECLGRQFSYLGTSTTNKDRAKSLLLSLTMQIHDAVKRDNIKEESKEIAKGNDKQIIKEKEKERIIEIHTLYNEKAYKILIWIVENTQFKPAMELLKKIAKNHPILKNEYQKIIDNDKVVDLEQQSKFCYLCYDQLEEENVNNLIDEIVITIKEKGLEFSNFLVGTRASGILLDKEDEFRAKYKLENGESIKANLNRLIGKTLEKIWKKPHEIFKPEMVIQIHLEPDKINLSWWTHSLYIYGRYQKFVRDLPQTHWHCPVCRGRKINRFTKEPCDKCNGTGDLYSSSIEDLIGKTILEFTGGKKAQLHGAGREDVDARCLGIGRPFVLEIKEPVKRNMNWLKIEKEINKRYGNKISVSKLQISNKKQMQALQPSAEKSKKTYQALIYLAQPITKKEFDEKIKDILKKLNNITINQRTPLRVVHRRADITRKKFIENVRIKYIDPVHILSTIVAEGGTYIKEFISGDTNRTYPSFSALFKNKMVCVELDVIHIHSDLP